MTIVPDAIERITNILDVNPTNLTLVTELAQIQADMLSQKLGGPVPAALTFIVVETTIARYRRVGAEGVTDKTVDVIQHSYSEDLFAPYADIIAAYAIKNGNSRIVRVI